DDTIELVVNLTPPEAHYDIIKRALLAGKHVYTEKAITSTLEEAKELIEIADDKGLYLASAPDTFLGSSVQTAKKLVESGAIGTITGCHASINRDIDKLYPIFRFLTQRGAGIGMDLGVYFLTALCSIMGPVTDVCGMTRTVRAIRTIHPENNPEKEVTIEIHNENQMTGSVRFASGALGTLNFNGNSIFPEQPQLILYGTEGILYLSNPNGFGGDVKLVKEDTGIPDLSKEPGMLVIPSKHGFSSDSRGVGAADLAWSVRKGVPNRASKEMAYHIMEILIGLEHSMEQRQFVEINSTFVLPSLLPEGFMEDGKEEAAFY
ncbi:MAG: Gfo/Idh/MocA family oxidoreductase, partial [Mobilitalea sp.]